MEYIGLLVIVIIISLLWFVNYQNHSQNQKIQKLNEQVNELIYAIQVPAELHMQQASDFKHATQGVAEYVRTYLLTYLQ